MTKLTSSLILIFIFTSGFYLNSNAQTTSITFGSTQTNPSINNIIEILGQSESGIYIKKSEIFFSLKPFLSKTEDFKIDTYLEFYDNNLKLKKSTRIILPNKDLTIDRLFYHNNTIHLFVNRYDKETKTDYLYGTTVNSEGHVNEKMIEIHSYQNEDNNKKGLFDINFFSDKKAFLVTYHPPYKRNKQEIINFLVLDLSYKITNDVKIKLPYDDKDFSLTDYVLDSKGNIHFLARIDKMDNNYYHDVKNENTGVRLQLASDPSKEKGSLTSSRKIYSYYQDNDEFKEHIIDVGANYISDIKIKINSDNHLICSGFYSDINVNTMTGIFFIKIDINSKSIALKKTKDFTEQFLSQFMNEKKVEKGNKLINYEIRDIIIKDNGDFFLLSEYYGTKTVKVRDMNPNAGYTSTISPRTITTQHTKSHLPQNDNSSFWHHHYNDILVAAITKEGSINWWARIPKRQHSVNDNGDESSIAYALNKDKLHIIYNDHPKNMNELDPEKLRNGITKNAMTVLVTVSVDGKVSKTPLFSAKENKTFIRPKVHLQSSQNELIIFASRKKDYRFARLKFE